MLHIFLGVCYGVQGYLLITKEVFFLEVYGKGSFGARMVRVILCIFFESVTSVFGVWYTFCFGSFVTKFYMVTVTYSFVEYHNNYAFFH